MKRRSEASISFLSLLVSTRATLLSLAPTLEGVEQANAYRLAGLCQRMAKARPAVRRRVEDLPMWSREAGK